MHAYSLSEQLFFGVGIWAVAAALLGLYLGRIFARAADGYDRAAPNATNVARGGPSGADTLEGAALPSSTSDSPWRREMTHRAALAALARYPRLDDELPKAIYPFAAERERILRERRQKGVA